MNETWSSDCLSYIPQFQEILAQSTDMKLNLYTCALKDLNVLGHASYPWSHDEDSVYNGVVINPGTLPGGAISPINEGDNLVHEVGFYHFKVYKPSAWRIRRNITPPPASDMSSLRVICRRIPLAEGL
jgi:hypothetical protein